MVWFIIGMLNAKYVSGGMRFYCEEKIPFFELVEIGASNGSIGLGIEVLCFENHGIDRYIGDSTYLRLKSFISLFPLYFEYRPLEWSSLSIKLGIINRNPSVISPGGIYREYTIENGVITKTCYILENYPRYYMDFKLNAYPPGNLPLNLSLFVNGRLQKYHPTNSNRNIDFSEVNFSISGGIEAMLKSGSRFTLPPRPLMNATIAVAHTGVFLTTLPYPNNDDTGLMVGGLIILGINAPSAIFIGCLEDKILNNWISSDDSGITKFGKKATVSMLGGILWTAVGIVPGLFMDGSGDYMANWFSYAFLLGWSSVAQFALSLSLPPY